MQNIFSALQNSVALRNLCHNIKGLKGAFTLAQFRGQFCTKLAHLVMKKNFFSKTCKLNVKSRAKFANVNAPLGFFKRESNYALG